MDGKQNNDMKTSRYQSVICEKCKCNREARDTILCSQCKKRFDFHCIGLSEKLYRLMQAEKKSAWKCKICLKNQKELKSTRSHTEDKNITIRKRTVSAVKQTGSPKSELVVDISSPLLDSCGINKEEEFEELEESSLEMLSKSEDYSTIKICEMQEMKEEIKELKISLSSTQNELENTIIENNEYKREINKLKKEIEVLKNICQSPIIKNTNEINKGFHVSLTPSKTSKYSHTSHFSPISLKKCDKKCNNLIISLQNKIKESQKQLLNAKKEITELENQIQELSIKLTSQGDKEQLTSRDKTEYNEENNAFTKQNIFIMGTQQCTGLAAELTKSRMNSRYEGYQVTAFIKPFASTEEVLKLCTNLKVDTHDKEN
ncbi:unnamed protein product [Parnassius mnemosyne]|uniref:PHD-type domain-containing protein n=1 Tax=Parnassius mnemosyne TaxID=213953 RepID=A0AAV1KHA7_9NEOP